MDEHRVVIVAYPGIQPLDAVGPHEVFAGARQYLAAISDPRSPGYRTELVARRAGPVRAESGLALHAEALPDPAPAGTLLLPGGDGVIEARADEELVAWVRASAARADRVATVCSGAFLAAAAGLLDGRRVTTHWARAGQLAAAHPEVRVDPDPLHLRDGNVWSSAGVTAGIDLALALVEHDTDAEVAQTVARWLVMFLRRPGGQSQFAAPVWERPARRDPIRWAQDLIHGEPGGDLRVPTLASRVGMSPRHFSRAFSAELGQPPGRYVGKVRVEAARRLLEQDPDLTTPVVARRCGFGTAESLRRAFLRRVGVPPDQYRRRFATATAR